MLSTIVSLSSGDAQRRHGPPAANVGIVPTARLPAASSTSVSAAETALRRSRWQADEPRARPRHSRSCAAAEESR
jgi:hypothetical protein